MHPLAGIKLIQPIFLILLLGARMSFCFIMSPPLHSYHQAKLAMSYLDNLSPQSDNNSYSNNDNEKNKKKVAPWKPSSNKGGSIPSGRGPEASYLDIMTGGGGSIKAASNSYDDKDDDAPSDDDSTDSSRKMASWSNVYLTDLLTDDSRTDIRNLLTQRAIQSFMRLLEMCRDPHSAKWIQEDFLETGNLLDYHGSGAGFIEAFGGTWDAPLIAMIQKPKQTIIVSAKRRGRGHGGWSKNNPFLEERWMELPIDINPPNLCERILTVREQIAQEWVTDLDIVVSANNGILDSYFDKIMHDRDEEEGGNTGGTTAARYNNMAFERTAVNLINDKSRFTTTASSPFRRANFDLLYNLCTQAAIHRLLRREANRDNNDDLSFAFLKDFYTDRAEEYFDGETPYGAADDFIDELLQTSPAVMLSEGEKTGLIDPLGTAEQIIRMRNTVALEWKEIMRQTKDDHIGVRQAVLTKQIQTSSTLSADSSIRDDADDDMIFQ